jgi:membrane-bound serine protease (ClpP class)
MLRRFLPLALVIAAAVLAPLRAEESGHYVHVVLEGTVDLGMAPLVQRAVAEAEASGARGLFIELNTLGGRVDAALLIRDALLDARVPTTVYVRRAISAGALIALSADTIDMGPGATIGAATPVQVGASGEAGPVDEKFTSYLRKEFGSTAEARERRADVAEAMVDRDVVIEGIVEAGKLLTLSTEEALSVGVAARSSGGAAEALEAAGLADLVRRDVVLNWAERIARVLTSPVLSGLLLTLGMLGLIFELKSPGFGVPGGIGLGALVLFFAGHWIVRLAGWEDALLVLLGVVLLAVEVFVTPGFGVAGLIGLLSLCGGLVLAMVGRDWHAALAAGAVSTAVTVVSSVLVATVAGAALLLRYFPETRFAQRTIVLGARVGADGADSFREDVSGLVGLEGTARTPLRPSGTVVIDGRRLDAVSEGPLVDVGARVRVVDVRGASVVVRPAEEDEA